VRGTAPRRRVRGTEPGAEPGFALGDRGHLDVLAGCVRGLRDARAVVDRRDAQFSEPGHVGPAELGAGRAAHRGHERGRGRGGQARECAARDVEDGNLPAGEQRPDVLLRLSRTAVRGEPVVDRHHARVGHHVARDSAADRHRVEALVILQPVDDGPARHPGPQQLQDRASLVDRVPSHPGPGGMRSRAGRRHAGAQCPLAAALDRPAARFEQHREVAAQQRRVRP
jgi:hypothetical protein